MSDCKSATPSEILLSELMDSRVPKNEREHFAAREINRLRARVDDLEARIAEADKQEPRDVVPVDVAINAVRYVGSANYESREIEAIERIHARTFDGYSKPVVSRVPVAADDDVCRVALEKACIASWINADLATVEGAMKAIESLCAFDVQLATDPATNGGKVLVDKNTPVAAVPDDVARDAERLPFDDVVDITTHYRHGGNGIVVPLVMVAFNEGHHEANATWKSRDQFASALNAMLAAKAKEGGA